MSQLVLVRHGQSLWNHENRFTGWVDVPLTDQGRREAREGARLLRDITFDVAYTSVLKRATETLEIILDELGQPLPIICDPALNERHYGDLQGLNKSETAARYGDEQVHIWRRSFDVAPPNGESLKQTAERALPFLERAILGDIRLGKNVLVVAHGNSNRAIVMKIEGLEPKDIMKVEVGTGVPIVYQMSGEGKVMSKEIRQVKASMALQGE